MKTKLFSWMEILPIIIILAIAAFGIYLYPQLPNQIPSHWNINGEIDGWASRNFAVFFFPGLILAIYALMSGLVYLDPLRKNIESFSKIYFWMKTGAVIFLSLIYSATLLAGLGYEIDVVKIVIIGMAMLFLLLGLAMPAIKKNYMIGIRLPWTLHSEKVWDKTHKLGGKLFIGLALLVALSSFLAPVYSFWILMGGIALTMIALVVYSYLEFRKVR